MRHLIRIYIAASCPSPSAVRCSVPHPIPLQVIAAPRSNNLMDTERIQGEFPDILGIKESLIKYVFEPAAANKAEVCSKVREMRGR